MVIIDVIVVSIKYVDVRKENKKLFFIELSILLLLIILHIKKTIKGNNK